MPAKNGTNNTRYLKMSDYEIMYCDECEEEYELPENTTKCPFCNWPFFGLNPKEGDRVRCVSCQFDYDIK